ncbi:MAG TPA: hypothetical protein VMG59_11400 [Phycisphaerae bacterium]|nr:hypothetical protein [Phycisphaerae bacterium]
MVLILVVAVIVLLALMGTVYILSANLDKQTSSSYYNSANLQGATQNVLSILSGVMAYSSADLNGNTLQIDPASSGLTIARTWDFPEFGSTVSLTGPTVAQTGYFQENINGGAYNAADQNVFTEPWLTADMPWQPNTTYYPGNTVFSYYNGAWGEYICTTQSNTTVPPADVITNWAAVPVSANFWPPVSVLTPYLYDPATGSYDIAFSWPGGTAATTTTSTLSVTSSDPIPNASVEQPEGSSTSTPSPYGTPDALWNLLPTSDSNGTYYRFAVRILDLNSRLNLNTGYVPNVTYTISGTTYNGPSADPYGEYLTSCPVFASNVSGSSSDNLSTTSPEYFVSTLQTGNTNLSPNISGRECGSVAASGLSTATSLVYPGTADNPTYTNCTGLLNWQHELWYYEQQGQNLTSATSTPGYINLFNLADLLGLLAYGEYGSSTYWSSTSYYNAVLGTTSFYSTPSQLLTNTLEYNSTAPIYGTGYRDLYTTYSWDRNIAPTDTGDYANFKDFSGNTLWPRMLDLNASVGGSLTESATLAGEIEQAMVQCGYSQMEGTALAVNYLQYRFNKGSTTSVSLYLNGSTTATSYKCYSVNPTLLTSTGSLYLPWIGTTSTPWTGDAPSQYYVGQAPQPFLNQFEIQVYNSGTTATPTYQIVGWGLELMNPYAASLYLKNWGLYVSVAGASAQSITTDLSSLTNSNGKNNNAGIPGYTNSSTTTCLSEVTWKTTHGSISVNGSQLSGSASSLSSLSPAASSTPPLAGETITIYLTRPCPNAPSALGGTVAAGNAIVDEFSFIMPSLAPASSTSAYAQVQRDNVNQVEWGCDSFAYLIQSGSSSDYGNLGLFNTLASGQTGVTAVGTNPGMPLYDRWSISVIGGSTVGYNATSAPFLSDGTAAAAIDTNDDLVNWDDFNCIPRETTELSTTGASTLLSVQINANSKLKFVDNETLATAFTNEDLQANLYFDFAYDPRASFNAYNTTYTYNETTNTTGAASTTVQPTIMSMMTLVDRASDPSISPTPSIPSYYDLTRIPGRININTASEPVLLTAFSNVPDIYGYPNTTVGTNKSYDLHLAEQMVLDTIAFRQRLASGKTLPLVRESGTVTTTTAVPVSMSTFNGAGFHSTADLLIALLYDAVPNAPTPPTATVTLPPYTYTLQMRDAAWADVANFCTVRSDTFAVYGYIQALQVNPNYNNGTVNSVTDWYNANLYKSSSGGENSIANTTATTTNGSEFILVGSERFVAIIDRSEKVNTSGTAQYAPRIVAFQILPQ